MKAGTKDGGSGYAVIWCRDFRLQALRRRGGREVPVALVSGDRLIITPALPLPEHEIQSSLCPRRNATIPRRRRDRPLLSLGFLTFRFLASALVNWSSRTFAITR